jgi:hypothetical protein
VLPAIGASRNSSHGTAICFPLALDELALPNPLADASGVPPAAVPEAPLGGVTGVALLEVPEAAPPAAEPDEAPVAAPLEPLSERIAKSILPTVGLTMKSLIVPTGLPEVLVI